MNKFFENGEKNAMADAIKICSERINSGIYGPDDADAVRVSLIACSLVDCLNEMGYKIEKK